MSYSGGSGTLNDPYQISTLANLVFLSTDTGNWDKNFVLTDDIDASTTSSLNDGSGFSPIGNSTTNFSGSLDGGFNTVTGLTIDRGTEDNIGLFGYIQNCNIFRLCY
jgi:hypothetical protein